MQIKTLRWCEPFGNWGPHNKHYESVSDVEVQDTGLCNRILHWEVAYSLNKINNFKYKIVLPEIYWPELKLLELPNTTSVYFGNKSCIDKWNKEYEDLNFKTVFDIDTDTVYKSEPINREFIETFYKNNNSKLELNHYHSNFGFITLSDLYKITSNNYLQNELTNRPLSLIKLKHKFIRDSIRQMTKNLIGIHIRRGSGVDYTQDDVNSFNDKKLSEYYKEIRTIKTNIESSFYPFVQDSVYFRFIENVLKINSNQQFYISTDLPLDFLNPYYHRFGDKIITHTKILDEVTQYLHSIDISFDKDGIFKNTIKNVIDLFSLSYCKILIKTQYSTWGDFARFYRNVPYKNINEHWEHVVHPFLIKNL
jgi:hypothetical protein